MAFNLATALLSDPLHLASFKKESTYDEVDTFLQECTALFPKCPKWAALRIALDKDSGKWVSGGALKCAREIHHILGKKVTIRAEEKVKAAQAKATAEGTVVPAPEAPAEAEAPAPEEEAQEIDVEEQSRQVKVNADALAKAHAEAEARIAAKAAPKAKAPKLTKAKGKGK